MNRDDQTRASRRRGHHDAEAPDSPTDLDRGSWKQVAKRTVTGFQDNNGTDWAAALTYYGVLSIFPALLALISVLGLLGAGRIQPIIERLESAAPSAVRDLLVSALEQLQGSASGAGLAFFGGLVVALFSASRYVAGFMRAANDIYGMPEGRPLVKKLGVRLGITVALMVILSITVVAVTVTGPVAREIGSALGLADTAVTVWDYAKWPVLLVILGLLLALLYWAAPNVKQPGFRWLTTGGLAAVVLWIVASVLFALYVANFGTFNQTYGSVAGVIVFLVWLWISNVAVLLGAQLNAELERSREVSAGMPFDQEPFLEPRDASKLDQHQT